MAAREVDLDIPDRLARCRALIAEHRARLAAEIDLRNAIIAEAVDLHGLPHTAVCRWAGISASTLVDILAAQNAAAEPPTPRA